MDSSTVLPRTSSTEGNNTAKLFFLENISIKLTPFQVNQWVTLSGLQLGRLCKRRDNSLQVENEINGLAATIDGRRAKTECE